MSARREQATTPARNFRAIANAVLAILRRSSVFAALVIIAIGLSFVSPYFLTVSNLLNVLLQAATVSIVAAGLTVVLIAGEIDLSIGSLIGMTGSVAAVLIIKSNCPVPLGILLSLLAGILAGFLNGLATVVFRIPSFIVTLAMLGVAQGAGLLLTNGRPVSGFPTAYAIIGQGHLVSIPIPVIIAILVYLIIHLALTKTKFGVEVYATGGSRRAAEMAGIRVNRIIIAVFSMSGLCGAIAGVVLKSAPRRRQWQFRSHESPGRSCGRSGGRHLAHGGCRRCIWNVWRNPHHLGHSQWIGPDQRAGVLARSRCRPDNRVGCGDKPDRERRIPHFVASTNAQQVASG